MTSADERPRFNAGWATYRGDCSHMVGEVKGPTMYRTAVIAEEAQYDADTDRTRVRFGHARPSEAAELRGIGWAIDEIEVTP